MPDSVLLWPTVSVQELRSTCPTGASEAIEDAYRRLAWAGEPSLVTRNHAFHQRLVDGITVEFTRPDGSIGGALVHVFDFDHPEKNDWLAVNQFTIVEGQNTRRPDVLIFINGLPVALMELKNPADENVTIWSAFKQIQTYKDQIPSLFTYNELLIISDGLEARVGSMTADTERFMPWRTIEGEELAPSSLPQLQVVIEGLLDKRRLLDFLRYFVVFEDEGGGVLVKKIAGYHQYHAVNRALTETISASDESGDQRVGVVWHTQGSGKSLTMAFYAGRLVLEPKPQNPTIVVITDRNDLDDQLYGTFSRCYELLRQAPVQAEDREHLRSLIQVSSGGVVFTTIQKFMPSEGDRYPQLSDRRNVIVIADEAHRSQYDFIDGFARHMRDALPHASFIGFTGTPIEKTDANTRSVFGDYISIYDIQRAVEDTGWRAVSALRNPSPFSVPSRKNTYASLDGLNTSRSPNERAVPENPRASVFVHHVAAQFADKASACSSTVRVAFSCLSGG